ncbi:hypothetical protein MTR67_030862 [Solanum verrucosum]|uniref:Uncharacterized protein n=1 Tax=Solanum verrucosum TaxID=315347 RepID=A0AAF0U1E3_SOLVR|nr:hypothetical protein MTR67_030862 [Solanum verrucosum]
MSPRRAIRSLPARRNVEKQELPNAHEVQPQAEQRGARQEGADTSRIREFLRMHPPSFTGSSTTEDLQNFIEKLKKDAPPASWACFEEDFLGHFFPRELKEAKDELVRGWAYEYGLEFLVETPTENLVYERKDAKTRYKNWKELHSRTESRNQYRTQLHSLNLFVSLLSSLRLKVGGKSQFLAHCRSRRCTGKGETTLIGPDFVHDAMEKVQLIRDRLKTEVLCRCSKVEKQEFTSVKVLWKSQSVEKATWEAAMKAKYPHLFLPDPIPA